MAGKVIPGPDLVLVGEGRDRSGLRNRTAEVTLLAPGSVVAPWPHNRPPSRGEAMNVVMQQLRKSGAQPHMMGKGGVVRKLRTAATGTQVSGLFRRPSPSPAPTPTTPAPRRTKRLGDNNSSAQPAPTPGTPKPPANQPPVNKPPATPSGPPPPPTPPGPPPLPSDADLEKLRIEGTKTVGRPIMDFLRQAGKSYDTLAGATPELQTLFAGGLPSYGDVRRLSATQQGALRSLLRANEVNDEDFFGAVDRDFAGFAPGVRAGQRARIMSMLR